VPNVVTANRLTDGIVVYLAPDGSWTEEIARARLAETENETKSLEEQAAKDVKARKVVAVYPMDVALHGGTVDPLSVRERIRAAHRTTLTKDWYDVPL
jgi:aromatic ring-opening dioxygenase LigB subunit